MSTDNNNPTQSINEQLIAVLRPVLHSLPLEVVKAAIPAEARDSGFNFKGVNKSDVVPALERAWDCKLTLDDLFPADLILDYMNEYIADQGLMSHEEAQEHVKDHVPLGDMYSTEELIEHLRESSRAGEIFDSNQLAQLFHMADDKPEMDELYDRDEIGEFITDRDISDFIDSDTLAEHVTDSVYLADLIDDYYGWDDAVEAVSSHVSLSEVAEQYGESDIREYVQGIAINDVYDESQIREYVQGYGVTEWYHPEMVRDNHEPSDFFTPAQMLENLDRVFKGMQERVRELTNRQVVNN